jgi:hypothetical protein
MKESCPNCGCDREFEEFEKFAVLDSDGGFENTSLSSEGWHDTEEEAIEAAKQSIEANEALDRRQALRIVKVVGIVYSGECIYEKINF